MNLRSPQLLAVTLSLAALHACSSDVSPSPPPTADSGAALDSSTAGPALDMMLSPDDHSDGSVAPDVADLPSDAPDVASCTALPAPPTAPIVPTAGELYYEQLGLSGVALGESAIVIGPQGKAALIDVGNDSHLSTVLGRLDALGVDRLEAVVITHFHADHGDAIEQVFDALPLDGDLIYRGDNDITAAANDRTAAEVAAAANSLGDQARRLCDDTGCAGLGTTTDLDSAVVRFIGANATMAGESFVDVVGPLHADDSNGENARSVVATIEHGNFRMLVAGDLTGGGSDTDDVESFYAPRLAAVSDIDNLGVDVLHAGHHGRNTSTNATWAARLIPLDGNSRNVVVGISQAHLRSPHSEVLDILDPILGGGNIWTTRVAVGGATSPKLITAGGGRIVVATVNGGEGYVVQAVDNDTVVSSKVFPSVRGCHAEF